MGNGVSVSVGRAVSVGGMVEEGMGVSVNAGGGVEEEQEERRKLALSHVEVRKDERKTRGAMCWGMCGILIEID